MSIVVVSGQERKSAEEASESSFTSVLYGQRVYPTLGLKTAGWTGKMYNAQTSRRYIGFKIPDFHARRKRGDLLPHTYWKQIEVSATGSGVYDSICWNSARTERTHYWLTGSGFSHWDDLYMTESVLHEYVALPPSYLVQMAAAEIYESGYDLLTSLVEVRELPKLFLDTSRKLVKYSKDAYAYARKKARGTHKQFHTFKEYWDMTEKFANEWLQARYGWRTLLYDIDDISKSLANYDTRSRKRIGKRCKDLSSTLIQDVLVWPNTYFSLEQQRWDSVSMSLVGSVVADISIPKLQVNPAATAWEATKLSFVVDWVADVGQAISAASFLYLQKQYAASCGAKVTVNRTVIGQPINISPLVYSGVCVSTTGTCTASYTYRQPTSIPYKPLPRVRLNVAKVADIVAILRQSVPKKRGKTWQR